MSLPSVKIPRGLRRPNKSGRKSSYRPTEEVARLAEVRKLAMDLRKEGRSYQAIADALTKVVHGDSGTRVSIRTAFDYVQAELHALRQATEMDTQSVRDMELERCDTMLAGLWPRICKGDPQAVGAGIRVMERRSKLLGLDAPTQAEFVGAMVSITPADAAKLTDDDIKVRIGSLMNRATLDATNARLNAEAIPVLAESVESAE